MGSHRTRRHWLLSIVLLGLTACENAPPTEPEKLGEDALELDVEPWAIELLFAPGLPSFTWQLSAWALMGPGDRRGVNPVWHSTNPEVVKVDANGRIETASRPGTALVIGSLGKLRDTVAVTVSAPTALVISTAQRLLLPSGPDPLKEPYGVGVALTYATGRFRPVDAPIQNSDSTVVRLIAPNRLVALRPGEATLTATAAGFTAVTVVKVESRVPILDFAGPNTFIAGLSADTISIAGRDLSPSSVIRWNGERLETWTPFHRSLRAVIPARLLTPGTAQLTVYTPPPGGGESITLPIFVETEPAGPATHLALDGQTSCSLHQSNRAFCWGFNASGEIGDGTRQARLTPVPVWSGTRFASLDLRSSLSCGVDVDGVASCWGTGTPTRTVVPASVRFTRITVGQASRCALDEAGAAHCWGSNSSGQLGDGTTTSRTTPAPVAGGQRFVALSAADVHACGVTSGGDLYCWGAGALLGQSGADGRLPVRVPIEEAVVGVDAHSQTTCAVGRSGAVYCWGGWAGTPVPRRTPASLTFSDISVSERQACGVDTAGNGWCWDGVDSARLVPGGMKWLKIATTVNHACGIVPGGDVYCWGSNFWGQLGTGQPMQICGTYACSALPVRTAFY